MAARYDKHKLLLADADALHIVRHIIAKRYVGLAAFEMSADLSGCLDSGEVHVYSASLPTVVKVAQDVRNYIGGEGDDADDIDVS